MKEKHHGVSATGKKVRQKKQYGNMQLEQSVKQSKCNTKKCNIKRAQNEKGAKQKEYSVTEPNIEKSAQE